MEDYLDINKIKEVLPHRFPFLLVDRILSLDDTTCVGMKNFSGNEKLAQEYFDGKYLMQGVLQVEAMGQVAAFLLLAKIAKPGDIAYFATFDKVRFRRPARPGDQLIFEVKVDRFKGPMGRFIGRCLIEGEVSCEARFSCMMVPKDAM
jgi:3-hydroxyacyl-[acyl-carrier-protein] dehydratase